MVDRLQELQVFTQLLAVGANEQGAWRNVDQVAVIVVSRTATGGTYVIEVDWSRDGVAVDLVETLAVPNNGRLEVRPAARFARFRVHNTDAVTAFTAHRTLAYGS